MKSNDLNQVPSWLGGTDASKIPYGGTIKKGALQLGAAGLEVEGEVEDGLTPCDIAAGAVEKLPFDVKSENL